MAKRQTAEEGTEQALPGQLEENPNAYLSAFRKRKTVAKKLEFYRDELTEEEQHLFFVMLNRTEKKALLQHFDADEKARVDTRDIEAA